MPQPFSWWCVVQRARAVPDGHKIVWDAIRQRDHEKTGDGCFEGLAKIAARAGKPLRTVERIVSDLHDWGLLERERRGQRMHYWVRLPEACYPTEKPTDKELDGYATVLDSYVTTHHCGDHVRTTT